ncbi:uncharacterized protein LAJ45_11034 [Morchella importuna]|uniref:uncharacterized protein n=1 Tax=Morchella importuna TaxID=1174673 RepID=UPI001E8E15FD|nr:uncharacterized protein LAJ45_11034 [Morchella importuna]KAH8144913.1 hypothetical protein LAJ45_11034 [Morchella importuna]
MIVITLYEVGLTYNEIEERTGVKRSTCWNIVKRDKDRRKPGSLTPYTASKCNGNIISSSPITQGAAPTSWRAFCATSAQRVRHRQSTTFAPGSAVGPSHSLGPPGDMAHVRRALANALVAWAAMRFPPPPETLGWSDSAHST